MTSHDTIVLFLSLAILLALARAFGEIARHFHQPIVLGELVAGVMLGPSVLGHFAPQVFTYLFPTSGSPAAILDGLRTIAIVIFLLNAGLEVELSTIWRQGKAAAIVGATGIALPFVLGVVLALIVPTFLKREPPTNQLAFTLFMGTAMSISALPVIARILMDLRLYRSNFGMLVIAAAVLADIVGWLLFAGILSLLGQKPNDHSSIIYTAVGVLAFTIVVLTVGRWIVHRMLPWIQAHTTWPTGVLTFALALACLCAACTEWIGIHAIFGAFLVGVAIGDSSHLREHTRSLMSEIVSFFFAPLFFASIGLRVDFVAHFDWRLTLLVVAVACVAKIVGCGLGALWAGLSRREAAAVGVAMNARGAMEIVLGLLALQAGVIGQRLFVSLVVMALVTSMMSGPLIRAALGLSRPRGLRNFLNPRAFIKPFNAGDSRIAIKQLTATVASITGLNENILTERVLQREDLMPTGIGNGIAIPHTRMEGITAPIVALGISESGIDFDAPDGQPAHFIFLIIASQNDDGAQVSVLAEIARVFANPEVRRAGLLLDNFTELLALLKIHSLERSSTPAVAGQLGQI